MKKFLSIILCLILLFSLSFQTCANEKANLILEYNGGLLKAGQTLTAKFIINNNSGFGCVAVHIGFNKNTLELKEVKKTYTPTGNYVDVHANAPASVANNSGKYVLGYVPKTLSPGVYSNPITHNGVFAELTFVAKKDCIPEIAFIDNYVDFFLDDEALTQLPYNLMINKIKVNANANINGSSTIANSSDSANIPTINENDTAIDNSSLITNNSKVVNSGEVLEENNNSTLENQSNEKGEADNSVTLLIVALCLAVVLILAGVLVKAIKKKTNKTVEK